MEGVFEALDEMGDLTRHPLWSPILDWLRGKEWFLR